MILPDDRITNTDTHPPPSWRKARALLQAVEFTEPRPPIQRLPHSSLVAISSRAGKAQAWQ